MAENDQAYQAFYVERALMSKEDYLRSDRANKDASNVRVLVRYSALQQIRS